MSTSDFEYDTKTGLANMGNTCFMNSALQILTHCDELTHFVLSHNLTSKLSGVYKQYLREYNTTTKPYLTPNTLKSTMGNKFRLFNGYGQQDSHEFMINFLDFLEEDLKKEKLPDALKGIVSELFDCTMKTVIKSTESKEKSTKDDPVRFLCVSIPNKKQITLEDCLMQFIGKEKIGESDGSILWETPSGKREKAIKVNIITKFPKYLIFQVKRYSFQQGHGKKLSTDIQVREKWTSVLFPEGSFYELKGFIFQAGGLGGGHYVAYVKIRGDWFCFNDSSVNRIDHIFAMKIATKSYLLFYVHRLNTDTVYLNGELDSEGCEEYEKDMDKMDANVNNSPSNETIKMDYLNISSNNSDDEYINPQYLSKKNRRILAKQQKEDRKKKKRRKIYVLTSGED